MRWGHRSDPRPCRSAAALESDHCERLSLVLLLVVEAERKRVDVELPTDEPPIERLEACGPRGLAVAGDLSKGEAQDVDASGALRGGDVDEYLGRGRARHRPGDRRRTGLGCHAADGVDRQVDLEPWLGRDIR